MRARNPGEARVIFISGYAARDFARTLDEEREVLFLPKPFTLKQLAEMVKKALAGKQSPAAWGTIPGYTGKGAAVRPKLLAVTE